MRRPVLPIFVLAAGSATFSIAMSGIALPGERPSVLPKVIAVVGGVLILVLLVWQAVTANGVPDPLSTRTASPAATLDIAVLVFREGLECILVLSAITVGMRGGQTKYRRPIAWGALAAFAATLVTWVVAVRAIDALTTSVSALAVQAATGLLAIAVLLLVMNWFFHRIYWTGWIGLHNKRKRELLDETDAADFPARQRLFIGLAMLGFTSLYREGFEVVLFLQSYRLKLGGAVVLAGVAIGSALAAAVAVLTFVARRRLPYKQMLIATGALLGVVLLVMVGEQGQEMQLVHWIPTTPVSWLSGKVPDWAGVWFSVFPTVETLVAQGVAAALVIGSYTIARARTLRASANAA